MNTLRALALGLAFAGTATSQVAERPAILVAAQQSKSLDGKLLFQRKCLMCHASGAMGTNLIARRSDPKLAEIAKRPTVPPALVTVAVRGGIGNMPWIPRADLSDSELEAIAGYLSGEKK